ncbi:hypothetical protein KOW79_007109 [Hemibagrus wyckioides]|uniref:Uncharacterized protein n=1 Tax=Hemibagrus wyckioides TaxID=337641 RepID=A0A9D3NXE6_9TELE|nr:hypothetical protein KOW79_007109 [Hemibagrus wyckioides]
MEEALRSSAFCRNPGSCSTALVPAETSCSYDYSCCQAKCFQKHSRLGRSGPGGGGRLALGSFLGLFSGSDRSRPDVGAPEGL